VATSAPAFFAMAMKDQTAMGVRIWCSAKSYLSEKYGLGLALPPRSVMISGICIAAFWIRICIAAFLDVWWQGDPVFLSCALNTPSHLLSSPPLLAIPP